MTNPDMERPEWLADLTDALSEQSRLDQVVALRPGIGARPAAVLILIGEGPDGPEIMFVERAVGMRTHPGQIAFPGGAAEDSDHDLADTALREAAEETGVDRSGTCRQSSPGGGNRARWLGWIPERPHRSTSCPWPYSPTQDIVPRRIIPRAIPVRRSR